MKILYAKRERTPDSLNEIAWTASRSYAGRCLTYNGRGEFIGTNHVQSVIKFGLDLTPATPDEVPDWLRQHAKKGLWRL